MRTIHMDVLYLTSEAIASVAIQHHPIPIIPILLASLKISSA